MARSYEVLPTVTVSTENTYSNPPERPELVYMDDPATDIIINFETIKPIITSPKATIDEANVNLKSSGAHIMLVVENDRVVGVVSSEDILGEKPMRLIQERHVPRNEILVRTVMTPIEKMLAIDYKEIEHCRVGNVVSTLTKGKQHFALIVDIDEDSSHQRVHGLVYIYDIIKHLDKDLPTELREARSLLELQKNLS